MSCFFNKGNVNTFIVYVSTYLKYSPKLARRITKDNQHAQQQTTLFLILQKYPLSCYPHRQGGSKTYKHNINLIKLTWNELFSILETKI